MIKSRGLSLIKLTLTGTALATVATAQEYETGGIQLTFGTSFGIAATDNSSFDTVEPETSIDPVLGLSFGLLSATPASIFAFDAQGDATYVSADDEFLFESPKLTAAYTRESADARLSLTGSVQRTELSSDNVAVIDSTGLVGFVDGTGQRLATSVAGNFVWGLTSRVSYDLSIAVDDLSYSGGVATSVNDERVRDNQRVTVGAATQLDLTRATQVSTGLTYSRYQRDGLEDTRDTVSLDTTVTIDRPLGSLVGNFDVTHTDSGNRYALSLGRTLDLPLGAVEASAGVTRQTNGDIAVTAQVGATRATPQGSLGFDLSRSVSSSNELDEERLLTQVSIDYARNLTPLSDLQFGFDVAQIQDTSSGDQSVNAALETTYIRQLTQDWKLDIGYRHRYQDDGQTTQSNTVFLDLRRDIVTRF